MQFGASDAIHLGAAFRAGAGHNCGAALVEPGDGIFNLAFCLAFHAICFHVLFSFLWFPQRGAFREVCPAPSVNYYTILLLREAETGVCDFRHRGSLVL